MFPVGLAGGAANGLRDINTMQILEPGAARPVDTWVLCDRCEKWRRIPQSVADSLAPDAPWYCEMNTGSIYNDCDVPQELSDQQIDQLHEVHELEEAEAEGGGRGVRGGSGTGNPRVRKHPPVWQLIKRNIYTHRARKQQDEDDIMICQCPRLWGPPDPKVTGCGPNCLNRMLNIECVTDFCPCGERCSNQMFTRREYAQLDVKRAGAKGFGLFSCKDLSAGDFIIEYIGEVLEEEEYLRRKEFFISTGQRHYYFMNVGNGEVIDACRKGGLGRFINHSCDPNCETQKWLVNGELAIGLFAIRDVAAGEELTFDYNFERYGDKPMKCLCGSKNCRGIIGGTQEGVQNISEAVVPLDADKELEPIMVTEAEGDRALAAILDLEVGLGWEKGWSNTMQRRLQALAAAHGLDLEQLSEDEGEDEEEVEEAAEPLEKLLQGRAQGRQPPQRQRGQQRQRPASGRQRRRGAALSSDEDISDISSDEEGSASLLGKPQHPQRVLSDEEGSEAGEVSGGAPAAATTSSGRKASGSGGSPSIKGAAAAAAAAKAARQEEQRRRQQRRQQRQAIEDDREDGEEAAVALVATLHAAGSRKERILAASRAAKDAARASQQLPLRKRLKKLARAAKAAQGANAAEQAQQEGGSAVGAGGAPAAPATSTASQRSAGALAPRPAGKPSAAGSVGAGTHSVASTSTALAGGGGATAATTAPLIPKRVSSTPSQTAAADRIGGSKARRRSEIDRRLDDMMGPSGKLRDTSPAGVIRFLRLFNLCDIGPTLSKAEEAALQQQEEQERERYPPQQQHKVRPRPASPAGRQTGSWQDRQPQQAEQAQAGQQQQQNSRSPPAAESGGSPPTEPGLPVAQRQRQEEASPGEQREEGEVTPAGSAGEGTGPSSGQPGPEEPPRQEAAEQREPSAGEPPRPGDDRREQQQQPQRSGSPVRYRERGYREQDGVSQPRPGRQQAQRGELSPRQRARLADMSLLLDVILKTNSHSARKEFVKCGILRQLLATIGHNTGTQYKVVLRKVIRVVESLPCVADDFHFTRSAHGSFADLLREMAQHSDFEVRSKAWGLLKQYPVKDCTRPVNDGPWGLSGPANPQLHSGATGSSRGSRASRGGPQGERHLRDGLLGPVRSPSHRGSLPGPHPDSSTILSSPGYPGPSPHRDPHPPSRLGRPPYGGPHGGRQPPHGPPGPDWPPHPLPMPPSGGSRDPPPHPRGEPWGPREPSPHRPNSRPLSGGYPGPAPGQRQGGASRRASEGSERDRWRDGNREGQPFGDTGTPAGRPAPLPSVEGHREGGAVEPPLPTPEGGRAAAESIAAALLSSAGAAAAGEVASPARAASAALGTVPSTRRKRSRWERDDEPTPGGNLMPAAPAERRQVDAQAADGDGGGNGAVEAGADARPSLLPPGFGGAAALHDSPPPRPPSVLATSHLEGDAVAGAEGAGLLDEAVTQDVPGALVEPPSKRSAPGSAGFARSPAGSRGALQKPEPEAMAVDAAVERGQADDQGWAHPIGNGTSVHGAAAERWSPLGAAPAENGSARPGWGGDRPGEAPTRVAAAEETNHDIWRQQQQQPYGHQRSWRGITRPHSGTLSDVSRGDSASSGGSQRRQQHQPPTGQPLQHPSPLGPGTLPPATANGGSLGGHAAEADTLHSPLTGGTNPSTSSHSLPGMNGLSAPVPFVGGGRAVEVAQATADSGRDASFFKVAPTVLEESWDEPVPRFERYVDEMVRARIGKYLQPGHPAHLESQEAMRLYKKVSSQVVAKEREAFAERQRSGLHKPIVRSKLEGKIREFVRDSVRRLLQHHGRPSGGA